MKFTCRSQNIIEPLEIDCDFHQTNIVFIYAGNNSYARFIRALSESSKPGQPACIAPYGANIMDVNWANAVNAKITVVVGVIKAEIVFDFIDMILLFGALGVCCFDDDGKLHLKNADIFRSEGFQLRSKK